MLSVTTTKVLKYHLKPSDGTAAKWPPDDSMSIQKSLAEWKVHRGQTEEQFE